jgi:hypothetical protein
MKNITYTLLLLFSISFLVGFNVGDEIELDQFVNARWSANFLKKTKNIKTQLKKGTTGKIVETHQFYKLIKGKRVNGNLGINMKVTSGPKKGKTYWVYYNKHSPSLKLLNANNEKVDDENITDSKSAVTTRDVSAIKDPVDKDLLAAAKIAELNLESKSIKNGPNPQSSVGCPTENAPSVNPLAESVVSKSIDETQNPAQESVVSTPTVPTSEAAHETGTGIYTPHRALSDINSSELKFMGREIMPWGNLNSSCVYQNAKVYVIYDNCMANKKEDDTTNIKVIYKEGGLFQFITKNNEIGFPNSQARRDQYNYTWQFNFTGGDVAGELNMSTIKSYVETAISSTAGVSKDICGMGASAKAKSTSEFDNKIYCYGKMENKLSELAPIYENFWINPPEEWYSTQKMLRKVIEGTSFTKNAPKASSQISKKKPLKKLN